MRNRLRASRRLWFVRVWRKRFRIWSLLSLLALPKRAVLFVCRDRIFLVDFCPFRLENVSKFVWQLFVYLLDKEVLVFEIPKVSLNLLKFSQVLMNLFTKLTYVFWPQNHFVLRYMSVVGVSHNYRQEIYVFIPILKQIVLMHLKQRYLERLSFYMSNNWIKTKEFTSSQEVLEIPSSLTLGIFQMNRIANIQALQI